MTFVSPLTGAPLRADTPYSLREPDGRRWPVIDGIAYLRAGSESRAQVAVAALDAQDERHALKTLLGENDRWWDGPAPEDAALDRLIDQRDRLSLREAMALLGYGRVGDYFAHRWSDPTFVAGLALIDAHWTGPSTAFELACGIGHYLRELQRADVAVTGSDTVFSKLWLARHFVLQPEASLVCFDAEVPWPLVAHADLVLCHDAFYFFERKAEIARRLKAATEDVLLVGHVHNRDADNYSAGAAISLADLRDLFPGAHIYADEELTVADVEGRVPLSGHAIERTEAFGIAWGRGVTEARSTLR